MDSIRQGRAEQIVFCKELDGKLGGTGDGAALVRLVRASLGHIKRESDWDFVAKRACRMALILGNNEAWSALLDVRREVAVLKDKEYGGDGSGEALYKTAAKIKKDKSLSRLHKKILKMALSLGYKEEKEHNKEAALLRLEAAADACDQRANYLLGRLYDNKVVGGISVERNPNLAWKYYEMAAALDHPRAWLRMEKIRKEVTDKREGSTSPLLCRLKLASDRVIKNTGGNKNG